MTEQKAPFQVRLSPAALDEIDELVEQARYSTRSDFMQRAAYDLLKHEKMKTEPIPDPVISDDQIEKFLESDRGVALLHRVLKLPQE